jgi:leader peptidase (prepilin peptidase) / N-methyltransferase
VTALLVAGCTLLGLLVGSFLNVVIARVPVKQSVVTPRSRCPGCGTQLAGRDNVPVLSWLVLRGRCRTCSMPISPQYPLVELLTAVLFGAMAAELGADWALPAFLVLVACLVAVSFIDLAHFLVPNKVLAVTLVLSGPLLVLAAAIDDRWGDLGRAVLGGLIAFAALLFLNLLNPRFMGMGDVKLAFVLGLHLGWISLGRVPVGLFLGFLLGAVGGILLIATGIRTRKDHIPFAPFLSAGALLAIFFGGTLLDWYGA